MATESTILQELRADACATSDWYEESDTSKSWADIDEEEEAKAIKKGADADANANATADATDQVSPIAPAIFAADVNTSADVPIEAKGIRNRSRVRRIKEERRSYADVAGSASAAGSALLTEPIGAQFKTSSVRVFEPTDTQVFNALNACHMIRVNPQPPESFRNGTEAQVAIYNAFYKNPRGIHSKQVKNTVYSCWKTTTTCLYAKLIAIIYELAGRTFTEEAISAIDFYDFSSMYHELVSRTGNHWFGVYPIFLNARIHIETFSHQCAPDCPVAHIQRELRNVDARDRQVFQDHIIDHMAMYKHPTHSGPPGRPPRSFVPLGGGSNFSASGSSRRNRMRAQHDLSSDGNNRRERPIPDITMFPGISIAESLSQANLVNNGSKTQSRQIQITRTNTRTRAHARAHE